MRAALALGVDGIEFDIHASADGVPVLIHDETLDRTTDGSGPVSALTFAQLRALDAGARYAAGYAGERIPALHEVVDLAAGRCLLVVEVKQKGIADLVVDVLRRAGSLAWTMIWSFDLDTVATVRRLEPLLPAAQLLEARAVAAAGDRVRHLEMALANNLAGISVHHAGVDAGLVRTARLRGLSVYTWTANDPDEQRRLAACGVDAIASDVPAVLQEALGAAG